MTATVHVVTPSFNAEDTIDRTMQSVLSQAGDFRIRYHIQDGGSQDRTLQRIEGWKRRLREGGFLRQCQGIRLTWASGPDEGMYDALVKGFDALDAPAHSFMTWINADDILMPGALALAAAMERQFTPAQVSWFGGAVCILRDDIVTTSFDRPIPREALRLGFCDGTHWDYLQQEGTFFRRWLWSAVEPDKTIAPMKLAGDWNLWRLMAAKASFAQTAIPLGGFRESRAPTGPRDKYIAEIDEIAPASVRRAAFEASFAAAPVLRRRIRTDQGDAFTVLEEAVDDFARHRWEAVFGQPPTWTKRQTLPPKAVADGKTLKYARVNTDRPEFPDIAPLVKTVRGMVALDQDWQFPAITEQHAYHRMLSGQAELPPGTLYVAFPWATLIDKLDRKAKDRDLHLDRFEQFCARLPRNLRKVTVCQHIRGHLYLDLFRQAGIGDVFWSHATHEDTARDGTDAAGPRLWPFPLFPVQVQKALPEAGPQTDALPRRHLFSFVGARANKYYLTKARNWILDLLADDPRGLVVGRDNWHYQKVVYDLQVNRTAGDKADARSMVDDSAAEQFRASLVNSTFSLCPSGSGPNSIRLWESLGAGSIPVILADTWAPPGDRRLWEMAAVFCAETPEAIRALPDRLAEIAADPARLARMRHAMRQLWLLYGPQGFVTDVQEFLLSQADPPPVAAAEAAGIPAEAAGTDLVQAVAGALLLDPAATLGRIAADPAFAAALRKARAELPDDAPLARHYDAVHAHAERSAEPAPPPPSAPRVQRKAAPKIHFLGRHAKRTPLSYAPIRRLVGDRLETVAEPERADLLVTGFNLDLRENIEILRPLLASSGKPKIAVLSEEPLWDITWSGPFTGREARIEVQGQEIAYTFLGHETSDIYEFERLPYFVLTSESYAVRYANMMARFRDVDAATLLDRWTRAPVPAAFFAEKRKGDTYARSFPERDVAALSTYRTEVAEAAQGEGILRAGKGWGVDGPRQDLPDWHLDKLAQLDGRTRMLSAIENVHQRLYISEKIFDAFAVGAVPVYWAGPKHRVFDLVPEASMVNCHGLGAQAAAARVTGFVPDAGFAAAWLETCARLAALFGDAGAILNERRRVAEAVVEQVLRLV